jgi:Rhodopirellula transposase DDE domain
VIAEIESMLEPDTAGDPISGLRWTHRTTAKIAAQLLRLRIRVSTRTVARLLHKLRFSLRASALLPPAESGDQRRRQEEGTGGEL